MARYGLNAIYLRLDSMLPRHLVATTSFVATVNALYLVFVRLDGTDPPAPAPSAPHSCCVPRAPTHASCLTPLAAYASCCAQLRFDLRTMALSSVSASTSASASVHWGQQVNDHMLQLYVSCVLNLCYKCIFQIFQLFQTYVATILSGCCICCTCMFQMFQLFQTYVVSVLS
jgi:hypothetical protein